MPAPGQVSHSAPATAWQISNSEQSSATRVNSAERGVYSTGLGAYSIGLSEGRSFSEGKSSQDVHQAVLQVKRTLTNLTTASDSSLVRAVPLSAVLEIMGSVFRHNSGNSNGFQKSQEVNHIDDFLSHNWSTGRWTKFWALSLHYNMPMAIVAMWAAGLGAAVLTANGTMPAFAASKAYSPSGMQCLNSLYCGYFAFLFVLFFGNKIRQVFCLKQRLVFLDKLCIHQDDPIKKLEGIRSLATFLRHSDTMVVLYTNCYLRRLWTVYEVASFLTIHRDHRRIAISPDFKAAHLWVFVPLLVLEFTILRLISCIPSLDASSDLVFHCVRLVFINANVWMYCFAARQWCRSSLDMRSAAEDFAVRNAGCREEGDRKLIHANITIFMKYLGKVRPDASQEEALTAFDDVVRREMPKAMEDKVPLLHFPTVVVLTAGYFLTGLDQAAVIVRAGMPWSLAGYEALDGAFLNFVVAPIGQWCMARAFCSKQHLKGCSEIWHVVKQSIMYVWPPVLLLIFPTGILQSVREFSLLLSCSLFAGYVLSFLPLVWWLFRKTVPPEDETKKASMELCLADLELDIPDDSVTDDTQLDLEGTDDLEAFDTEKTWESNIRHDEI